MLALRAKADSGGDPVHAPIPQNFCFSDTLNITKKDIPSFNSRIKQAVRRKSSNVDRG
uniref:Uncharacterized protein n=1 Tax=Candidatus Kentrum sp. TUN TaxID=2126343 RepID=A0A450ZIY4_9GAMM|nr:MAG: hypothetical protein BECKTUN1418F_GA0071002_10164 [Candidatus Kentron sp. TUN]VFK53773.1 MAG: hypothetical protein BECKTUN1418E_GA0071001_10184 [Candidatus Kentron sp. TUN]VFK56520.1 MAG: hypothetical protein BECKTUN1418D_GA0071000_104812 [Candidatus Kentron sp. TUN]